METTPSKFRAWREQYSRWARQRDGEFSEPATSDQMPNELKDLLAEGPTRDSLFDWADAPAHKLPQGPPLFADGQLLADRFEIVRFLGRGGMGEVYEATNRTLGQDHVALKTLNAEVRRRPDATERFMREVKLAQRVSHPNICRIHDIFTFSITEAGSPELQGYFLTMQLLDGETLAKYMADHGPFTPTEALPVLRSLADALQAAHAENVVHRDLKPGNVILIKRAGGLQPVITDFGLAALIDLAPDSENERSLARFTCVGTPDYAAPEQLLGHSSPASDVYSLGVVALEMLTGSTSELGLSGLPPRQRQAISRCLQTEPTRRFERAADFIAALSGQPLNPAATAPTSNRRAFLITAAAVAAGGVSIYFSKPWQSNHSLNTLSILPFELAAPAASFIGFQEELVRAFLKSRKVKLIAPYSTGSLHAPFQISSLAKLLPADGFLLGTVSNAAVLVRLFRRDGSKLWEKSFTRSGLTFDLNRDVVSSVLTEVAGSSDASAVTTHNHIPSEEGYRAYVAARASIKGQTAKDPSLAEALFSESVHHDGAFAQAFSGLGYVLFLMGGDRIPGARAAIARALALDADLAEAHMVNALILHRCDWNWTQSAAEFKRALDLEPYNFAIHQLYGGCLADRGYFSQGLPEMQTAADYDPLSYTAKYSLGIIATHARQFDLAIQQLQTGLAIARAAGVEMSRPYIFLGACSIMKGNLDDGYNWYTKALASEPDDPRTICHFIFGAARSGHPDEARVKMSQLLQMHDAPKFPFYTGLAFAALGNIEKSLDYLEKAVSSRDPDVVLIKIHLYAEPLHSEPRYQAILQAMGLV